MGRTVGDGTGTNSTPEGQGQTEFEDAKPQNPAAPYDSNKGGRGSELVPARDKPLGS